MANPAARLVPRLDALGNFIRESWTRLEGVPGGKALFSRLIGLAAPYTATINAQVLELGVGRAKVVIKDRRGLRNHLSSVHAVALVNLAELTGNIALAYSLPDDARFIVAGLSIDYLKKARGPITGTTLCPVPETSERKEYEVPVELRDAAGDLVARAVLKTMVGPKKKKADA
jgi:acyl-coenzyme A thioesterase PaaI-like protein